MKKCFKELDNFLKLESLGGIIPSSTLVSEKFDEASLDKQYIKSYLRTESIVFFISSNLIKLASKYLATCSLDDETIVECMFQFIKSANYHEINANNYHEVFDLFSLAKEFYKLGYAKLSAFEMANGIDMRKNSIKIYDIINTQTGIMHKVIENIQSVSDITMDIFKINEAVEDIKKSYLNKKNSFEDTDIICVLNDLIELEVDRKVIKIIENYLFDKLDERIKKETQKEQEITTKIAIEKKDVQKKYLTDKEYRDILKEVRKYFNPYSLRLVNEDITSEEREYVASLMVKIDIDNQVIVRFLSMTDFENKRSSYEYFKDHVDEFRYYYGEFVDLLTEYMGEITPALDDESSNYWINAINDELSKVAYDGKLISYEYDIVKLKKEVYNG